MRIKKYIKLIGLLLIMLLALNGCGGKSSAASSSSQETHYYKSDIEKLKNTENFQKSALEHIFNGSINSSGNASGYHYDMIEDSDGKITGKKGQPDENGLYTAKVEVNGKKKTGNNGYSTFYPDKLSPQEVVDLINEAYENRSFVSGNTYSGEAGNIIINMYLDDNKKIISAFPVMD